MKKSIIAAALLILSTGILTSCTKEKTVTPTAAIIEKSTTANKKDVGTAD